MGASAKSKNHGDFGGYTRHQIASAQRMLNQGATLHEVAAAIGHSAGIVHASDVEALIKRGELQRPMLGHVPVERVCLGGCGESFVAPTRFIRLCWACRRAA